MTNAIRMEGPNFTLFNQLPQEGPGIEYIIGTYFDKKALKKLFRSWNTGLEDASHPEHSMRTIYQHRTTRLKKAYQQRIDSIRDGVLTAISTLQAKKQSGGFHYQNHLRELINRVRTLHSTICSQPPFRYQRSDDTLRMQRPLQIAYDRFSEAIIEILRTEKKLFTEVELHPGNSNLLDIVLKIISRNQFAKINDLRTVANILCTNVVRDKFLILSLREVTNDRLPLEWLDDFLIMFSRKGYFKEAALFAKKQTRVISSYAVAGALYLAVKDGALEESLMLEEVGGDRLSFNHVIRLATNTAKAKRWDDLTKILGRVRTSLFDPFDMPFHLFHNYHGFEKPDPLLLGYLLSRLEKEKEVELANEVEKRYGKESIHPYEACFPGLFIMLIVLHYSVKFLSFIVSTDSKGTCELENIPQTYIDFT